MEKALEFKEKGNDFFRQHNYGEAYKHYTLALQHCPFNEEKPDDPKNKDYSIILANRSAARAAAVLASPAAAGLRGALSALSAAELAVLAGSGGQPLFELKTPIRDT